MVDLARTWRGTRNAPVSIEAVEQEIVALSQRFAIERVRLDQWQAAYLKERLQRRRLRVDLVTIEPTKLDRLTTQLKGLFAKREILIPARLHDLIEQLESVEVIETGARNRRRDRLRFDSGSGQGAGAHDDLVVALALAAEGLDRSLGRYRLPEHGCNWSRTTTASVPASCGGRMSPPEWRCDCTHRLGWVAVKAQHAAYIAAGGPPVDYRTFYQQYFTPNRFVLRKYQDRFVEFL